MKELVKRISGIHFKALRRKKLMLDMISSACRVLPAEHKDLMEQVNKPMIALFCHFYGKEWAMIELAQFEPHISQEMVDRTSAEASKNVKAVLKKAHRAWREYCMHCLTQALHATDFFPEQIQYNSPGICDAVFLIKLYVSSFPKHMDGVEAAAYLLLKHEAAMGLLRMSLSLK